MPPAPPLQPQRNPPSRRTDSAQVVRPRLKPQVPPSPSHGAHGPHGQHGQHGHHGARPAARPSSSTGGPLTSLGVAVVLTGACLIGGGLDLLLVNTAAWALTCLFLAACVYTGSKVRRTDWYSAVVAPPLAFTLGLLLVACFAPHDLGQGLIGIGATMLELLALHAAAVFAGTALTALIIAARRVTRRL